MPAENLRWKTKKTVGLQLGSIQYWSLFSSISCLNRLFCLFVFLTLEMLFFRDLLSLLIVLLSVKAVEIVAKTLMFEQQSFQCDLRDVRGDILMFTANVFFPLLVNKISRYAFIILPNVGITECLR